MAKTSAPCRGCGADILRTNATAPIRHYCSPDCRPRCDVDGCDKPRHGYIYCSAHHTRWKRYGEPLEPLVRTPNVGPCSVDGCGQPMRKRTWCASHYAQWVRTGKARPFIYKWGSGGYVPAHSKLRRMFGPASDRSCVDCGGRAAEWSYIHGDPDEIMDDRGVVFSRDTEFYVPRCALCHRRFDRAHRNGSSP